MKEIYKGKELEFISFISRDGSGIIPVGSKAFIGMSHPKVDSVEYLDDDIFKLTRLSIGHGTYIAKNFNCWVVKIKPNN